MSLLGFFLRLRKSTFQEEKKKDLWCAEEAFRIILLQRHNQFYCVVFFLAAGNRKFQLANATAIAYDANKYPPDDWLKTG